MRRTAAGLTLAAALALGAFARERASGACGACGGIDVWGCFHYQ
jgi:hypothetical protein